VAGNASTLQLRPGERILLYSDGVTEAGAPERKLDTDGLEQLLGSYKGSWEQLPFHVMEEATLREGPTPADDVTVLLAQAVDTSAEPADATNRAAIAPPICPRGTEAERASPAPAEGQKPWTKG
jgi:sigma-B regulation protein RsbU (phosphoserine phosphatase)